MFKILIPVDFTEESDSACHSALKFASENQHVQLLLLHCFQDYLADADPDVISPLTTTASEEITDRVIYRNEAEALKHLERLYNDLNTEAKKSSGKIIVDRTFINGFPEEEILNETNRFRPDLILMGTKGKSDISRSLFGSITTKVVKDLKVPVLTIPNAYLGSGFNKVAYATDFNATDHFAIERLRKLLYSFNPKISCVHISEDGEEETDLKSLKELKAKLEQNNANQGLDYVLLEGNDVTEALQRFVQGNQVDLLALTTQKRSLLDSLFHSSVTKNLVLHADVPLLIFHASENSV